MVKDDNLALNLLKNKITLSNCRFSIFKKISAFVLISAIIFRLLNCLTMIKITQR